MKLAAKHHHPARHADDSQYGLDNCIKFLTKQTVLELLLLQADQLPADPSCLSAHSD